jgi:hypothetical protein
MPRYYYVCLKKYSDIARVKIIMIYTFIGEKVKKRSQNEYLGVGGNNQLGGRTNRGKQNDCGN